MKKEHSKEAINGLKGIASQMMFGKKKGKKMAKKVKKYAEEEAAEK